MSPREGKSEDEHSNEVTFLNLVDIHYTFYIFRVVVNLAENQQPLLNQV